MKETNETTYRCQREIESGDTCIEQCDHCREYYKPLDQPATPDVLDTNVGDTAKEKNGVISKTPVFPKQGQWMPVGSGKGRSQQTPQKKMKQTIITAILASAILAGNAQTLTWPVLISRPCGTWQAQPEIISDWHTVDTLGKKESFTEDRNWVYDIEKQAPQYGWSDAVFRPCGLGYPDIKEQYRICSRTGIRQKRERIIAYKYIEAPVSEFEKIIDSLNALTTQAWINPDTFRVFSGISFNDEIDSSTIHTTWLDTAVMTSRPIKKSKKRKP